MYLISKKIEPFPVDGRDVLMWVARVAAAPQDVVVAFDHEPDDVEIATAAIDATARPITPGLNPGDWGVFVDDATHAPVGPAYKDDPAPSGQHFAPLGVLPAAGFRWDPATETFVPPTGPRPTIDLILLDPLVARLNLLTQKRDLAEAAFGADSPIAQGYVADITATQQYIAFAMAVRARLPES